MFFFMQEERKKYLVFTGHNDDSPTQESQGFYAEHFPLCKIFPPNLEYNTLCLLYFKLREVL